MNLLTDKWIRVLAEGRTTNLSLRELLTEERECEIALSRDDMELACLSILVSLVQVVFTPDDFKALKDLRDIPMARDEFDRGIEPYIDWFDLAEEHTPFMQTRCETHGIPTTSTPIQKLFVGLPVGDNSHAFFNEPSQVREVCSGCAALALFNQASNAPNFSGKHKGGLKSTAMTTLVTNGNLRQRIWANVLSKEKLKESSMDGGDNTPVWIKPHTEFSQLISWIKKKPKPQVLASSIGLARGLFWQPLLIELIPSEEPQAVCDHCGGACDGVAYTGFKCAADFIFDLEGLWRHPHSPIELKIDRGAAVTRYIGFRNTDPAWTQLHRFLYRAELVDNRKEGFEAAPVVTAARRLLKRQSLHLAIGGYYNDQARIIQRRHERHDISENWNEAEKYLPDLMGLIESVKSILRKKLWAFGLKLDDSVAKSHPKSLANSGEQQFLQLVAEPVRAMLSGLDGSDELRAEFKRQLVGVAECVFDDATQAYRHSPKMARAYALNSAGLRGALSGIK